MRLVVALLFCFPLSVAADKMPPPRGPVISKPVCGASAAFPQCGILGSPCCLGNRFYFDPKSHQLPEALKILNRIVDRDPDEVQTQLKRLRDAGLLRDATALRPHPKLAALYAKL